MSDIDIEAAAAAHKKTLKYRLALSAVIILSILIVLALIALVVGAVTKFGGKGETPASAAVSAGSSTMFSLPEGARILSKDTQPGRLILHVRTAEGEEIDIIDTATGKLISRIKAARPE